MDNYEELTAKFLNRECSPEEAQRLLDYFRTEHGDAEMVKLIEATLGQEPSYEEDPADNLSVDRNRLRVMEAVTAPSPATRKTNWLVAASIIILLSIGAGIYFYTDRSNPSDALVGRLDTQIRPGGNRASLTLADGRMINLSEEHSGIVVEGEIRYLDGSEVVEALEQQYITLATPKGGTYHVTLSDGTRVWLNAASSLLYPSRFEGPERVVRLSGEAYFEVERSQADTKTPFKVITDEQVVEVLGTRFNLSAYSDDPEIRTTLAEGSVEVSTKDARVTLHPDQQSVLKDGVLTQREVLAAEEFAWVRGEFQFNDESLASIMRTLARWYGVEIRFEEERLKTEVFFGVVSRFDHITQVLDQLTQVGDVRFHMDGDTVHVLNKQQ